MSEKTKLFDKEAGTIRRENVQGVLSQALMMLRLKDVPCEIVGNSNVDVMNDIDVAIDTRDLVSKIGLDLSDRLQKNVYTGALITTDTFWNSLGKYLMSGYGKEVVINKGLSQFSFCVPARVGALAGPVQIDFMVGDRTFMREALSGTEFSEYKAAHRNILLSALCAHHRWTVKDSIYERTFRYSINWRLGVKHADCSIRSIPESDDETHIAYMSILRFMQVLSPRLSIQSFKEFDTFEKLFAIMISPKFMDNDLWYNFEQSQTLMPGTLTHYVRALTKAKLEVPYQITHYLNRTPETIT